MGTLEFSVKGLAEELRRRRDARRGPALLTILLIASLLVLAVDDPAPPVAEVQMFPASYDFGPQKVDTASDYRVFTLTNAGPPQFTPTITLAPTDSGAFDFKTDCAVLVTRHQCTVSISFKPRTVGAHSGQLGIEDEIGRKLFTVDLIGTGEPNKGTAVIDDPVPPPKPPVPPPKPPKDSAKASSDIAADQESLVFPPQQIGTNSTTQTVVLKNTRARQFFAGYNTAAGSQFRVLNCGFVLFDKKGTSGDSCKINVSFHPTTIGPHSEVLEIREMSAKDVPVNNVILAKITLEGSGTSAGLTISPRLLDFSDPNGSPQGIVVQNIGNVAVTINGAPITSGDSNRFRVDVIACRAQPVAPNSHCVITVTHIASQQQSDNAELEIFHTAASASEKVRLTWKAPLLPKFSVAPTSLAIGDVTVGGKTSLRMTLTNVGAAPANLVVMRFEGGDRSSFAIDDDSCSGRALALQSRCTATLVFEPKKGGSLSTNLVVSDGLFKARTNFSVTGQAGLPVE